MSTNRHEMGRRDFLIFSSTAALATATVGPTLFAKGVAEAPKRLAVGFAPFDENAAVVSASSVPAGDGAFISRGARISVFGSRTFAGQPRARRAVDLLAHFSVREGAELKSVPFRAWAASRLTGNEGNAVSFNMPVDDTQNLVFTVETERGVPSGIAQSRRGVFTAPTESVLTPVTLSLKSGGDALKLARGFYVIAPIFDGDSDPSWSAYTVNKVNDRWALADRDGNAAAFEHFVLRIDYASKS